MCKFRKATFTAKTPLVKDHCFIANTVKGLILFKTTDAQSIKNIARNSSVSAPTVQRLINQEAKKIQSYDRTLPENLSFDKFKYAKGQLAFEYIDAKAGNILDVLPSRDGRTVKNHFISHYSLREREKFQTITVDMNASYTSFIPILFPKAKIIINRFHIIQLINRSINKTRVNVRNRLNTSNGEDQKKYRRLKRYWKKMLKKESNLSYTTYSYYSMFRQRLEAAIVSEMLSYEAILSTTYAIYQSVIQAVEDNDFK
ncbi:transposase [Carnobacterium iners]|uniref:transposase n=1 Tax=Carnobacterium iners TaxID=1073423 RepID=UPI0008C98D2E|nr:transposase [Carnobacterium iners]SEK28705.1 Transposase [Carnobacterium iners]